MTVPGLKATKSRQITKTVKARAKSLLASELCGSAQMHRRHGCMNGAKTPENARATDVLDVPYTPNRGGGGGGGVLKPASTRSEEQGASGPLMKKDAAITGRRWQKRSWLQRNKNVAYNCYALNRKPPRPQSTTLMVALLAVTWEVNFNTCTA